MLLMAFWRVTAMSEFVTIGKADEVPPGKTKGFTVKGKKIAVFNLGGKLYAIGSICTHMGGPLERGRVEGNVVTCPWHGSRFDVTNGSVVGGPASTPEPSYRVRMEGTDLQIEV
jgi:nitrite reductase/ring-hydroxylating ferredoxin subunit